MLMSPNQPPKAPVAEDFPFCMYCQAFGHATNSACPKTEYNRRCPARYQDSVIPIRQPYRPSGFAGPSRSGRHIAPVVYADDLTGKCEDPACLHMISWPRDPRIFGTSIRCPSCGHFNGHPSGGGSRLRAGSKRSSGEHKTVELVLELLKLKQERENKMHAEQKDSKQRVHSWKTEQSRYKARPSTLLNTVNVLNTWPVTQPPYTDMGRRSSSTGEMLFKPNHDFNEAGNYQYYLLGVRVRLNAEHLRIQEDDSLDINKAGRMGYVLQCMRCDWTCHVRDVEGDLVMCRTDAANTVGCGTGFAEWAPGGLCTGGCKCNPLEGKTPKLGWIRP